MRFSITGMVVSCLLAAANAGAAGPARSPVAARVEGYLGAAVFDPDEGDTNSYLNGGGTGSVAGLFGPLHIQGDVFGDWTNLDHDATNYGGGGHLGFADPERGALELTGAYQNLELDTVLDDPLWRVGGEGELYLDPVTLGAQAGYVRDGDTNQDGYYVRGLLRLYPIPDLKLEGVGGVGRIAGNTSPVARALVEYRPGGWPIGLFARWEAAFDDSVDQHIAVAGVRLYLAGLRLDPGMSLRALDRVYFREACVHFVFGARTC